MKRILLFLATLCTTTSVAFAQRSAPIDYTLTIDSTDLSGFAVRMRIRNAPANFVLAAHAHPEYDDKYWRYLSDMRVTVGAVERLDSVRWQVRNASSDVTINYRIVPPLAQPPRPAWRAYLTPNGGVVGGPHAFLYMIGRENASANVRMAVPRGWTIATGLARRDDGSYHAPDIFTLMESPFMVGKLSQRQFDVARVPHHVYYMRGATPAPFDTTAFVSGIKRIVEQAHAVFGSLPYQRYVFMFADDAYGGLEHPNSVTLGATSKELAETPYAIAREIGHEFFHTWNLMRIKPIEYRRLDYRVQPPTAGLWFSEGLSILYSDLMMRRGGFTVEEPTRFDRLRSVLTHYANDPAYDRLSAEQISRTEYNSTPGTYGNLDPSTHQFGEVLGTLIDLIVRDATDGRHNIDDVMRAMDRRFHSRGFTSAGIQQVVDDVCKCETKPFFDAHVTGGSRIDINRYLEPFGWRQVVTRVPARQQNGELERDFRIRAWQPTPTDTLRIMIWTTHAIWSQAGLLTNDRVVAVNNVAVTTWPQFRTQIAAVPMGGNVRFDIVRNGGPMTVNVTMSGYDRAQVQIEDVPNPTARQLRLRNAWLAGQ